MRFQGIKSVIAVGQYIILYLIFVILLHKTVKCPGGKLYQKFCDFTTSIAAICVCGASDRATQIHQHSERTLTSA